MKTHTVTRMKRRKEMQNKHNSKIHCQFNIRTSNHTKPFCKHNFKINTQVYFSYQLIQAQLLGAQLRLC
jgi:hypothetical protein